MSRVPFLRRESRGSSERGAILIITALIMILLLMIAAFATDLGAWYRQGQTQQRSADVGSLNGIKAYDVTMKNYIASKGQTSFSGLSGAQQAEAEQLSFQAAVDAVIGSLAAGGTPISSPPVLGPGCCTPKPGFSSVTFTADDGTEITITRNASDEVVVDIVQSGTQYFTGIVRNAPEIIRSSTAVLSNCNADCSRDIELSPPFQGFNAAGQGDGWRPLIGNNGRIWTINHHATSSSGYDIVCMQRSTQAQCSGWAPLPLQYTTARKSDDAIDNTRDQLYFAGHDRGAKEYGIVCVDTATRRYCPGKEFTKLVDYSDGGSGYNYITGSGVFLFDVGGVDKLFAMSQDGQIHCLIVDDLGQSNPECPGYPKESAVFGHGNIPDMNDSSYMVHGHVIGSRLYFYHDKTGASGGLFQCWDPQTDSQCPWVNGTGYTDISYSMTYRPVKFVRYDTAGNAVGYCIAAEADDTTSFAHMCVTLNGTPSTNAITNLRYNTVEFGGSSGYIYGEGLSLDGERTVWGSRRTGHVHCYDWTTQSRCAGTQLIGEEMYGLAELSDDCIIGVGHSAKLYSFNPKTLTNCTGTKVVTDVYPCACADGSTRYGELELPPELIAVLNSATATVTGGATTQTGDLMAGPMDLADFNGLPGPLELTIVVDSKLDANGDLMWTQTYNANLALLVQPTLAE